jgi:hypothetical protein
MDTPQSPQIALRDFLAPFLGKPVWGAKQGYASFLSFEFCTPKLVVKEWQRNGQGLRRHAYVKGRWSIWIYCCEWRFTAHDKQIACSEGTRDDIACAMGMLDGQKLIDVSLGPEAGRSHFTFDLGGQLETWPTGDDLTEEQWFIYGPQNVFGYRADGRFSKQPADTPRDSERWHGPI